MDGIAAVEARIQEIRNQFGIQSAGGRLGNGGATDPTAIDPTTSFADALSQAQGSSAVDTAVPSTSGTLNKAGVDPVQWGRDFLTRLGMPVTAENMRLMKAWQQAEGTAARFNPLATTQSGFTGETQFNSVGVKNYTSYEDGLNANVKVITNGLYKNILAALQAGNSAETTAQAITNSPWGTGALVSRILAQGSS
jgi:hypothetical protein